MASVKVARRLIVNADDFGGSQSINRAVIEAHQRGILTSASLMVNGAAFEEAVALARDNPKLGVGLHLSLCCGKATLRRPEVKRIVNAKGEFTNLAVWAGLKYFFSRQARKEIAEEAEAQFQKFADTGLKMDHLNGHLHFHLHPSVFRALRPRLGKWQVSAMRVTRDPLGIDFPLGRGRWFYRLSHAFIFGLLSRRAEKELKKQNVRRTDYVFGLLENGRVDEDYILKLLKVLPAGDSEVYSHPSHDKFKHEWEALVSPRVAAAIKEENIRLIRYQDLWVN